MNIRDLKSAGERRKYLEQKLGFSLANIGQFSLDEEKVSNRNCENMVGAVQVPLGIAGPLKLNSLSTQADLFKDEIFLPLATTEGALIASVSRGCKAINVSGGVNVYSYRAGTTRGPVFYVESLSESKKFCQWLDQNQEKLKKTAEKTSKHLRLKKIMVKALASYVFIRLYFDTRDAMGMNMATIATQKIAEMIKKETGIACLSLAGNFDIDKKPAWLNLINNRGFQAWAEVVIPKKIVKEVLKTTAERLFEVWLGKCVFGSIMSGSLGFNAHYANIIAALFIATGQDPAHVVEGSLGVTTTKALSDGTLYCSVYLPSLMLGTVGGGTGLQTQKETLRILGLAGGRDGENAERFAELAAGVVLAGELSLLASLAEGSLSKAHETLGRGKK